MPKFAANLSLLFTELPLLERFAAARFSGFDAVEIQFPYSLPASAIRQQLDQHDLQLALFNVDADDLLDGGEGLAAVPEKQPRFHAAVEQAISYANQLQPHAINVLPGSCLDPRRSDAYWQTLRNNLHHASQRFAEIGVKTVFEAINSIDMPGFIIDDHAKMLELWTQVGHSNLALQYDIYHMTQMQQDCRGFLTEHLDKIGHIQFADHPGRHEPGTGRIDFQALFDWLDHSAYPGFVGAEYRPTATTLESLSWFTHEATR